jgi:hypothetical protein
LVLGTAGENKFAHSGSLSELLLDELLLLLLLLLLLESWTSCTTREAASSALVLGAALEAGARANGIAARALAGALLGDELLLEELPSLSLLLESSTLYTTRWAATAAPGLAAALTTGAEVVGTRAGGLIGTLLLDELLREDELDEEELLEEELDELDEELLEEASLSESDSTRLCAAARGATVVAAGAVAFRRGGFSTTPPNFPFTPLAAAFPGGAVLAGGALLALLSLLLALLLPLLLDVELELDDEDEPLLLSETDRSRLLLAGTATFFATGFTAGAAPFFAVLLVFAGAGDAVIAGPSSAENFRCRYSTFSSKVTTSDALAGMSFSIALQRCTVITGGKRMIKIGVKGGMNRGDNAVRGPSRQTSLPLHFPHGARRNME